MVLTWVGIAGQVSAGVTTEWERTVTEERVNQVRTDGAVLTGNRETLVNINFTPRT